MPNKIGMSKNNDSFGLIMRSSKVTGKVSATTPPLWVIPVGIKGTFWALIDFSLFAIGPNLHCPRIFCPLHLFLFLWLTIIHHSLHIWSTLLFHFWIRTNWNFLEIINGIIPLFYNMITLWSVFVYNLINRVNSKKKSKKEIWELDFGRPLGVREWINYEPKVCRGGTGGSIL